MALICDTGPLYAAMDVQDQDHTACRTLFETNDEPMVIPSPVLVELEWLATSRLGSEPFDRLLDDVCSGLVRVQDLSHEHYVRIRTLTREYRELRLGFVDASVLATVEIAKETKVATLDQKHFRAVRHSHAPYLTLVP